MAGGPSHIDTWDTKPDRPRRIAGRSASSPRSCPACVICEHLPQAGGDARQVHDHPLGRCPAQQPRAEQGLSDGQPARRAADQSRGATCIRRSARSSPSTTAPNHPAHAAVRGVHEIAVAPGLRRLPRASNTTRSSPTRRRACRSTPTSASTPAGSPTADLFQLPGRPDRTSGCTTAGAAGRLRPARGASSTARLDGGHGRYEQQAVEMVARPPGAGGVRSDPRAGSRCATATASTCGASRRSLARRLVEAGVAFVTLDLSYHTASGTWDTHGDNIPPYGGISEGPRAAAAAVRPSPHDAGGRSGRARPARRRAGASRWANSAARRRWARRTAPTAAITGRS